MIRSHGDCRGKLINVLAESYGQCLVLNRQMLAGPFSHRALLTLAEKDVPYKEEYIDFSDKPKWYASSSLQALCRSLLFFAVCTPFAVINEVAPIHRLFDVSPKGSVPVIKDLEQDKWVAGTPHPCAHQIRSLVHMQQLCARGSGVDVMWLRVLQSLGRLMI